MPPHTSTPLRYSSASHTPRAAPHRHHHHPNASSKTSAAATTHHGTVVQDEQQPGRLSPVAEQASGKRATHLVVELPETGVLAVRRRDEHVVGVPLPQDVLQAERVRVVRGDGAAGGRILHNRTATQPHSHTATQPHGHNYTQPRTHTCVQTHMQKSTSTQRHNCTYAHAHIARTHTHTHAQDAVQKLNTKLNNSPGSSSMTSKRRRLIPVTTTVTTRWDHTRQLCVDREQNC